MSAIASQASAVDDTQAFREARVEDLLGTQIRDVDGRKAGRIEELIAELRGTDLVVVEVHLGRGALLERLGELSGLLPLLGSVQRRLHQRTRVRWDQLDLADPERPKITVRRTDLETGR